ncbi:PREDICTED: maestro heat-like repeat-containing protein family member 1 [Priapulus caudatus]|uniref:Maestro heat-like repeat-containing protein family member 1 n=1 Tax=Priapulus caudatus TaxID=37621 RepID=A0ABM1ESV7_PRICU|nr:PREDICTED: maestro heat-like repeat-containing protein family member 1 [Priapulus caudatus]
MILPMPDDASFTTGGQVDAVALALIDAAFDKKEEVRVVISHSLHELGKKQPRLILGAAHSYLCKHPKLAQGHRMAILNVMERICRDCLDMINRQLAVELIEQASSEMTRSKDVLPDWQTAASGVLVAIGCKFSNEVMEELLKKFQPGVLPHFFIVQTLGNLAAANVYGVLPFLKAVLGTMLPMLGMAKHDNMRWVFSAALAKFSEAILEYIANIDKAPDPTVTGAVFISEIDCAYDVLFNVWLQSKEPKLRLAVVEALGHMAHLMEKEKLEEQLPKLISGIMKLYPKHQDSSFHITQGLAMVLDAATSNGSAVLETQVEGLLTLLFTQACQPPVYNNQGMLRNQNEVLRCFDILARIFSDRMLAGLLHRLESTSEKVRIGALRVFRHLINASGTQFIMKKASVISGLKIMLNENSNKVKKEFVQVIVALAHHDYLREEGGDLMIQFIVTQCSLPNDPPQFVADRHATRRTALATVCRRAAAHARPRVKREKRTQRTTRSAYVRHTNIPKPHELLARLLVLTAHPKAGRGRGAHVLKLMKAMSPNINKSIVALWDTVIPKLIQYLEAAEDKEEEDWSQKSWEDLILKLLSKTLDEVDSEDWTSELGATLVKQIPLYTEQPNDKNFLYKALGVVLRKANTKHFIGTQLEFMFTTVKHTSQLEREGCAIGFGYCASTNFETVITKLEQLAKGELQKKSSGIFSFIKDKMDTDTTGMDQSRATAILCYGQVAFYAQPSQLQASMDSSILRSIVPHFNSKEPVVKRSLTQAVELIGNALHPTHMKMSYELANRPNLLGHMMAFCKAESSKSLNTDLKQLSVQACTALLKLGSKAISDRNL